MVRCRFDGFALLWLQGVDVSAYTYHQQWDQCHPRIAASLRQS